MNQNASLILMSLRDKVASEPAQMMYLTKQLEQMNDEQLARCQMMIAAMPFKDPIIGLILGLVIGSLGADRFYAGHIGLGIAKLLVGIFTLGIAWVVWVPLDWFLVWRAIKEDNFSKLQTVMYV